MVSGNFIFGVLVLGLIINIPLISSADFGVQLGEEDTSDGYGVNIGKVTSSIKTFLKLIDTPSSYAGESGNCLQVNGGENSLIFGACGSGGGSNSTYNATYDKWSYNQTIGTYNQYGQWWYNQSQYTIDTYSQWWYQ